MSCHVKTHQPKFAAGHEMNEMFLKFEAAICQSYVHKNMLAWEAAFKNVLPRST